MVKNISLNRSYRRMKSGLRAKNDIKKKDFSMFLSVIAIFLSVITIYLQFFYEKFDLSVSIIDAEVNPKSINMKLIYNNNSNQDATIIQSELYYNVPNNKNQISFINKIQEPYILSPAKQVLTNLVQNVYFDDSSMKYYNFRKDDTLEIRLRVMYLNDDNLQSEKIVKCGWLTLDSIQNIDNYSVDYQKIDLNSNEYFSRGYSSKKK